MKNVVIICLILFTCSSLNAQVELAHLSSKGFSATGFGAFLHAGGFVSETDEIGGDCALYFFSAHDDHIAFAPLLATWRHTFNGTCTGIYLEPVLGYTFGGTDIQRTDASGNPVVNSAGQEVDQKVNGFTAGLGLGYIIPSVVIPLNIGLRYEHIFVPAGDPSLNNISLRLSYSLIIGKRLGTNGGRQTRR